MSSYSVDRFRGSHPRLAPHLIPIGAANRAVDCKLVSGQLDSFREPLPVRTPPAGTLTSYQHGCCWLDFDACVDIAQGPVTCQKLFITGWQEFPVEVETDENCNVTYTRLGLPCPTRPPSALGGSYAHRSPKDFEGRSYAYQYRDADGNLSALSPGSRAENARDGQTYVISGWTVPDSSWGVTDVVIYRTVTGHQSGAEAANEPDTTWMRVGETSVNAASFTDSLFNDELMHALEEDIATPPPADLQGIVWIESINTLAGFLGNRIYFSENNRYHHWPHFMDFDDNIRGIVESSGNIYVATDGRPYVLEGAVDCQHAGCRRAVRLPGEYPMVGWGSKRMARVRQGAVYPTHNGLVLLAGNGAPTLLTWNRYAPEDWQALMPESAIPVEVGGKLYVFARGGAFVMTLAGGAESGWDMDEHSELSDTGVVDAFVTRNGNFYILKDGTIQLWDRGNALRPHLWESHEHVTPTPIGYGAGHLHFNNGAEHLQIVADRRIVMDREVQSSREFRLPMWAQGTRWTFTLTGTGQVNLLTLATAMQDLR